MSTILECKNLSKKYGHKLALDGINLSLNSGRIIGLLGPNGLSLIHISEPTRP